MNILLALLFLATGTVVPADTVPPKAERPDTLQAERVDTLRRVESDTLRQGERVGTLRQIEVLGDSVLPVMDAIMKSLARQAIKAPPSLGDIIEKLSPGINDKITHPFAIKARKRERKHRRDRKVLEEYEHVKTFNDLLREACEREGIVLPDKEKK